MNSVTAEQMEKLFKDIETIKSSVTETNDKMKEMVGEVKQLKIDMTETKNDVRKLKEEGARRDQRSDFQEQYSRKDNMIIAGIPWQRGENLRSVVLELGAKLDVAIVNGDIKKVHRLPSKDSLPTMIVKMNNWDAKEEMIRASRKTKPTLKLLNIDSEQMIYCDEHLTPPTVAILKKAKMMVKKKIIAAAWTSDCIVNIRVRPDDKKTFKITTLDQLDWQPSLELGNDTTEMEVSQVGDSGENENQKDENTNSKRKIDDISPSIANQNKESKKKADRNQQWQPRRPQQQHQQTLEKFRFQSPVPPRKNNMSGSAAPTQEK